MKVSVRSGLFVALLGALLATLGVVSTASASHSWGNYHWARTSNPFTLKLGDNLTSSWDSYLVNTSADWSVSSVLDTTIVAGGTTGRRCRPTSGRVEVCNYAYGSNGWLGLAQIWISGSHITQGSVKVNDTYFSQPQYNNTAEKEHVMCQEVGHTFGLDHQDTSGASLNTCMDYYKNTSNSDTKSTRPNQHDYDQLATIYSHTDSSSTVKGLSGEFAALDLSAQSQWGNLAQTSDGGRSSLYVRDFGGGNKVFTFVFWAK